MNYFNLEQIPYELRQRPQFEIPWVHSVFSGTESQIWALGSFSF